MSDLVDTLNGYITEALRLRAHTALPAGALSGPAMVLAALSVTRSRLDRTEELLGNCLRLRAAAQRIATEHTAQAADAFDTAITANRAAPVQAGDAYSSARERAAEANLASMDTRHTARAATTNAHHCEEAVEVLRLCHRGLDGVRLDLHAMLRAMAFESHLER